MAVFLLQLNTQQIGDPVIIWLIKTGAAVGVAAASRSTFAALTAAAGGVF